MADTTAHYRVYVPRVSADRAIYEPHLPDHPRNWKQLDADRVLVLSGPFADRTGGMIIVQAADRDANDGCRPTAMSPRIVRC